MSFLLDYATLFGVAFVSATFFPLGSEAFFSYYLTLGYNPLALLLVATFGNTLGSMLNYWFGFQGESYLQSKRVIKSHQLAKSKKLFDTYGGYALLLSWAPIFGDGITFVAGILKYNFLKFFIVVLSAKFLRYLIIYFGIDLIFF